MTIFKDEKFWRLNFYFKVEDLKKLAQEVLELIKQTVGVDEFSLAYSKLHTKRVENKEERKRKSAQMVNNLVYGEYFWNA